MENKHINQSELFALENESFKKVEVKVMANDQEFTVVVDKDLKETKIAKMFTELIKRSDYARKENIDLDISAQILILLIKNFTDIEFAEPKDIGEMMELEIRTLNALIDLGLFEQIIIHFDKDQMKKIEQMFEKHQKEMKKMADDMIAINYASMQEEV